jgi:hypothetical protein
VATPRDPAVRALGHASLVARAPLYRKIHYTYREYGPRVLTHFLSPMLELRFTGRQREAGHHFGETLNGASGPVATKGLL